MSDIQRGIVELLHDLDRRARPGREPKNRAISKFTTLADTVQLSSDTITTTVATPPYQYTIQSYAAAVIANGPTVLNRFNEYNVTTETLNNDGAGSTATATATTGCYGAHVGATTGNDGRNLAISLDGVTGVVSWGAPGHLAVTTGSFTIEGLWYHRDFTAPKSVLTIQKTDADLAPSSSRHGYRIGEGFSTGALGFKISDATTGFVSGSVTLDVGSQPGNWLNTWVHLALVFDRSSTAAQKVIIYVNGVQQANALNITTLTTSINSTSALKMGNVGGWKLDALVDEWAFFNSVALTSAQVKTHYDAWANPTTTNRLVVGAGQFR